MRAVELETEQDTEILICSTGDGRTADGGLLSIPADTPENRRRALVTRGCPLCPDVNQGLTAQDFQDGEGSYVMAAYRECGHIAAVRLDEDEILFFGQSEER